MMYGRDTDTYQTIELRVTQLIPCIFLKIETTQHGEQKKGRRARNSLTLCQNAGENAKGRKSYCNKHLSTLIYQGLCLLEAEKYSCPQ